MNPGWLHRNRTLLPFFIALTALIVLNGASWWAYRIASSELRDNFRRNVTSLSEFLARQVEIAYQEDLEKNLLFLENSPESAAGIEELVPDFENWLTSLPKTFLKDLAPKEMADPLFHDLYLLGSKGGLLQTWSGELALGATSEISAGMWNIHPLFSGDRQAIIGSLTSSDTVVTDEELAASGFFLTCYSPIVFNNRCRGLVGVRANILFADRLAKMRRGLILAAAIGSILIALLTAMFYAVLGRLDRMQARMEQRERLAQLGQMVSIVAHEIRNPLGIIEQTSDLIRRKYSKDEPDPLLGYISEEVDRLNRLVNRFLDFARPSSDQAAEARGERSCDLALEIEEIHGLLLPQADSKSIEFAIEVEEGLSQVRNIDREGMKQILLNLILNAFDATPPGGSVRVVARSETGGVILRVIDEGDGMTPEQLKKATDPFYTTKEKGSGLGLALVAKMVEEAGATLEIGSSPGEGSCFTISFDN